PGTAPPGRATRRRPAPPPPRRPPGWRREASGPAGRGHGSHAGDRTPPPVRAAPIPTRGGAAGTGLFARLVWCHHAWTNVMPSSHLGRGAGVGGPLRVGWSVDGPHHSCLGPCGCRPPRGRAPGASLIEVDAAPRERAGQDAIPLCTELSPLSRSFADLGVPSPLLDVLNGAGITTPTPIQSATLPDALSGRDVLGRGR